MSSAAAPSGGNVAGADSALAASASSLPGLDGGGSGIGSGIGGGIGGGGSRVSEGRKMMAASSTKMRSTSSRSLRTWALGDDSASGGDTGTGAFAALTKSLKEREATGTATTTTGAQ